MDLQKLEKEIIERLVSLESKIENLETTFDIKFNDVESSINELKNHISDIFKQIKNNRVDIEKIKTEIKWQAKIPIIFLALLNAIFIITKILEKFG